MAAGEVRRAPRAAAFDAHALPQAQSGRGARIEAEAHAHAAPARSAAVRADARAAARARARSSAISRSRIRCSACCRATSAAARPSSPRSPRCRPSKTARRSRSWRRPKSSPSSTTASSPSWLTALGVGVTWLAGACASAKKQARSKRWRAARRSRVGTHALFQEEVRFHNLALAIVDEQHRFGVHQRLALRMKGTRAGKGAQPHQLMMSATPIPRTLAMSYYADLDVSVIDELPPGPHAGRDPARIRRAARRSDTPRARRLHGGQPGVLGLPAHRRIGNPAAEDRARDLRHGARRVSRAQESDSCTGA